MRDSPVNPSQPISSAAERLKLLHALVLTAARMTAAQMDDFVVRLLDALAQCAAQADVGDAALSRQAHDRLANARPAFQSLVSHGIQQSLMQAVQAAAEQGARHRLKKGAMDLSPLSFEAMEHRVLLDNLSQAIDGVNADALAALGLRIACWAGSDDIGGAYDAHNPFRSVVFLKAVSDAWSKLDGDLASVRCVMRQMRPQVFLRLDPILHALNQEMLAHDILPDIESRFRSRPADADPAPPPTLADRLQAWLVPHGTLHVIDARATLLLEKMSAEVLKEEAIPVPARALLEHLRPPLKRMALADKAFFFDAGHPARRLVHALIDVCLWCDPVRNENDRATMFVSSVVNRLCDSASVADPLANELYRDIEDFVSQEIGKIEARLNADIAEARLQEGQSHARTLAESEIAARLETGEVAGFLEDFLQKQWSRVLVFGFGVGDTRPEVLQKLLETMDELIWSVKPKPGVEERKKLIERLPAMLGALNAWLNVIRWQGAERDAFFAALAASHAAAMRAPSTPTPRHQLAMRMDAVQKASEHLLSRRARQDEQVALAEFMPLVDRLGPGTWVELVRNSGGKVNCRLLWVSPLRTRFVFVAAPSRRVFILSDHALAQALRAGRAGLVRPAAMIGRALAAALQELRAA